MSAPAKTQDPVKSCRTGGLTRRIPPSSALPAIRPPARSITKVMSESDEAKLAAATWVREQMDRHGLTLDDLLEAGCFAAPPAPPAPAQVAPRATLAVAPPVAAPAVPAEAEKPGRALYRNAMGQS